jgi:hypothetical protein
MNHGVTSTPARRRRQVGLRRTQLETDQLDAQRLVHDRQPGHAGVGDLTEQRFEGAEAVGEHRVGHVCGSRAAIKLSRSP